MSEREIVIHAMKVTKRSGRVKYLSVALAEPSAHLIESFRKELQRKLAKLARQHGQFRIDIKRSTDLLVTFENTFPERDLDAILATIASQHQALIFIDPGIPLSEMTGDPSNFMFKINLTHRRPNN